MGAGLDLSIELGTEHPGRSRTRNRNVDVSADRKKDIEAQTGWRRGVVHRDVEREGVQLGGITTGRREVGCRQIQFLEEQGDCLQKHGSVEAGAAPSETAGEIIRGLAGQIEQPAQVNFRLIKGRLGRIPRVSRDRHLLDYTEERERTTDRGDDVGRFRYEEIKKFPGKTGYQIVDLLGRDAGEGGSYSLQLIGD